MCTWHPYLVITRPSRNPGIAEGMVPKKRQSTTEEEEEDDDDEDEDEDE